MNKKLKLSGSSSLSDGHKLNDNRKNSLSGSTSKQVDDSQVNIKKHNYDEMNENNYSKQLPNLFDDVPNKQLPKLVDDSNMLYKNVGSASISNYATPWINSLYGNNSELLSNSFQVPNQELPMLVDDSNMLNNNVGSASTSNHTTSTWINRDGNGTSSKQFTMVPNQLPLHSFVQNMEFQFPSDEYLQNPLPIHSYVQNMEFQLPSDEYLQNPLPPPKEANCQMTESVSPYRSGPQESIFFAHLKKIMEDSDASRVCSSKVNLVDENGKKPISFENDSGANLCSNFTDSFLRPASSLLDNDDNNNLNDKLPHDVRDTSDSAINEKGIDWYPFPSFGSLDKDDSNNFRDKLSDDEKDTLDAAIFYFFQ
ncbi:hypothetical protein TSUD_251340 [Trifolium subterraneum]|uniref:Uncharacterized protein n=1 Tax=Trifolium subterraneum TaxID=3900 RepID=A0A2Z6MEN5_TRISU|nr:hypothetical protein TSUD_251340 [Trifolium subterraneum]